METEIKRILFIKQYIFKCSFGCGYGTKYAEKMAGHERKCHLNNGLRLPVKQNIIIYNKI
jgi:hypothetical protein